MKKKFPRGTAKKIVYLIGAGATQAEVSYQGGEPVILLMKDSEELGKQGVATRVIKRANIDRKFGIKEGTDIEKLISLLAATGIDDYIDQAEKLRQSYYEEIIESLNEVQLLNKSILAVSLLEMHNNRSFKMFELLKGIISLNHDNIFQVASQKVFGSINLGFEFDSIHFKKKSDKNKPPLILQLHGSFNWLNDRPIKVIKLNVNNDYRRDMLWIPPKIIKEAKDYPYNKLMGLAYELLVNECDVLRIIGCSLSQNDWNLISLLFNAQYKQYKSRRDNFKIELIMSNKASKFIEKEYSYLRNIIPITERKDGIFKDVFEKEDDFPVNSEVRNPFKYWLKNKVKHHISKKQFDSRNIGKTLKIILEA